MKFSRAEKQASAEREVAFRKKVYPKLVARGSMTPVQAATEIEIMSEIAAEYAPQGSLPFEDQT